MKTAGDSPYEAKPVAVAKPVANKTLGGLIDELGGAMKTAGDSPNRAKQVAK